MVKTTIQIISFLLALWSACAVDNREAASLPEPGPENGGLRLRLVIKSVTKDGEDNHAVRLDFLNVSTREITLEAKWRSETNKGNLRDYIEAAVNIETYPPFGRKIGQSFTCPRRVSPQPKEVIKPGDALTIEWQTRGRKLKDKVVSYYIENPYFATDGLYSVRAYIHLRIAGHTCLLRSNEQQVSVAGSCKLPKFTLGKILRVNADARTALIDLGTLHKIEVGDTFLVSSAFTEVWRLDIEEVHLETSTGKLSASDPFGRSVSGTNHRFFPQKGMEARLVATTYQYDKTDAGVEQGQKAGLPPLIEKTPNRGNKPDTSGR